MNKFEVNVLNSDGITENCGTKAYMIYKLKNMGIKVPEFYGVEVKDFLEFYKSNCLKKKKVDRQSLVVVKEMPEKKYMVRSSVVPRHKENPEFASMVSGAFESYVAFNSIEIPEKILEVWESFFSERAREQCSLFMEKEALYGMGVLIQDYIHPVISGVLHSKEKKYDINWIEGHLADIVQGKKRGNRILCSKSFDNETILRGVEADILKIVDNGFESVFVELEKTGEKIVEKLGFEIEMEWLFDGVDVWVVQCQKLM